MSVLLGNPDYSPIKGYAQLTADFSTINSTIFIQEGKIAKIEDNYVICAITSRITDLYKPEKLRKNTPVCLIVHTKLYERWADKDNPKVPTNPTPLEKLIVEWLTTDGSEWLSKNFSGELNLNGAANIVDVIRQGKAWQALAKFEECEPNFITSIEAKGSNKTTSYAVKELDKLTDRLKFVQETCKELVSEKGTLLDLAVAISAIKGEQPETYEIFMKLLEIIL